MHRYGRQNLQKFSLGSGNKEDINLHVMIIVCISIVLPAVSSIVCYWLAASVAPETVVQNTYC